MLATALLPVLIGVVVLFGWQFDVTVLERVFPNLVSMKPNTAVAFVCAGLSFGFLGCFRHNASMMFLSRGLAGITALIGLLTLCQYALGTDWGFDQFLFTEMSGHSPLASDGRMALMTSICFLLLGSALICAQRVKTASLSQWLVLLVGLTGILTITAYLYGASGALVAEGYRHTLMTVHSAFLFILMGLGVFFFHATEGLARVITADTLGGWTFRRLFPIVAIIPLLVGWLQILGEHSGYFNSSFRIAAMMVAMIPIVVVALWYTAQGLDRINAARHRAEELMRENEQSYRNQFADSSVVMMMIDPLDGAILDANTAALDFYGYTREQMLSKHITDINMLPVDAVRKAWETVKQGSGRRFEFQHRLADGSLRDVAVFTSRVKFGERLVLHSIINDITELKIAEDARRESEEKYKLLTDNAYSAIASHEMVFDERGRPVDYIFLGANPAFEKQTGLRVSDIIGRRVTEILPGIENTLFLPIYGQVVKTGESMNFEHFSEPLNKHYAVNAYSLGGGCFATVFTDITERKVAEERLQQRESFLNRLLETIPIPVFSTDEEGRYTLVNKAFATLFWKGKEEIIGKKFSDLCLPSAANDARNEEGDYFDDLSEVRANYSKIQDGLGVMHDVIIQKATLSDDEGEPVGVIGTMLDITDFNRMESELHEVTTQLEKATQKGSSKT